MGTAQPGRCAENHCSVGLGAVLVRPDGIVAWAGDDGFSRESFVWAASRWFGENRERK
ncbi:aromatic-ring hydroxylase C-terminal domain-containing protein [Amycolatopsis sp. NPDC054798]